MSFGFLLNPHAKFLEVASDWAHDDCKAVGREVRKVLINQLIYFRFSDIYYELKATYEGVCFVAHK